MAKIDVKDVTDVVILAMGVTLLTFQARAFSAIVKNNHPDAPPVKYGFTSDQINGFLMRTRMPVKLLASSLAGKKVKNTQAMN